MSKITRNNKRSVTPPLERKFLLQELKSVITAYYAGNSVGAIEWLESIVKKLETCRTIGPRNKG